MASRPAPPPTEPMPPNKSRGKSRSNSRGGGRRPDRGLVGLWTLVALAGFIGRSNPPAAAGVPYEK